MTAKETILVVAEPDNNLGDVIERAEWLATQYDYSVTLLWCDPDIGPLDSALIISNEARDIGQQIIAAQKDLAEELAAPLRINGLAVHTEVLEQRPISEGILQRASDLQPAFVIKGTEYHAVAERSIFVDTDWHLMRGCSSPLWLVKPVTLPDVPTILAAVDPTHSHDKPASLDQVIVSFAQGLASKTAGKVHLLHTWDAMAGIGAAVNRTLKPIRIPVEDLQQTLAKKHQAKLEQLAQANGIAPSETHILQGSATEIIPAFARAIGANLVIMGSLARWGLKRAVIGSTAERTLDQLPCDILIVRANTGLES